MVAYALLIVRLPSTRPLTCAWWRPRTTRDDELAEGRRESPLVQRTPRLANGQPLHANNAVLLDEAGHELLVRAILPAAKKEFLQPGRLLSASQYLTVPSSRDKRTPVAQMTSSQQFAHLKQTLLVAQREAIRTSLLVIAMYCLCYLPYTSIQTAKIVLGNAWYVEHAARTHSQWQVL